MAKLVEILAKHWKEWPSDFAVAVQDSDGGVCFQKYSTGLNFDGEDWGDPQLRDGWGKTDYHKVATDHATAIVTREMWEAERRKLEAPQPDWSKAPEGATHASGTESDAVFYKNISPLGGYEYWSPASRSWRANFGTPVAPRLIEIHRPTSPQWSGEGLPPIGSYAETESMGNVKIITHVKQDGSHWCAVGQDSEFGPLVMATAESGVFRPIDTRTPREKWIEAARDAGGIQQGHQGLDPLLAAIYDAGLAKLPE